MLVKNKILKQLVGLCSLLLVVPLMGQVQLGSDLAMGGRYGTSIALSDDGFRMISATTTYSNGNAINNIYIHQYQFAISNWVQWATITIPDGQLGTLLDISGDGKKMVASVPSYMQAGNRVGVVKAYEEINGVWIQMGNDLVGQQGQQYLAVSMSKDGNRIAIGTENDIVKVFEKTTSGWVQVGANLLGSGKFGYSVDLSNDGKRLAVGAPQNIVGGAGLGIGEVKIFEENNGLWTVVGAGIKGVADDAGHSIALSDDGKRVVVGSPKDKTNTTGYAGRVDVYGESGGVWTQVGAGILGNNHDYLGMDVGISGNGKRIIVGATTNLNYAGYTKVYEEQGSAWVQVGNTINGAINSYSGAAVSISRNGYNIATSFLGGRGSIAHVKVYEFPAPPSCIAAREITSHYCKRRVSLLEPTGTVHHQEIVLAIDPQEFIPNGACTATPASWTHFNITTESFPNSGPMTTPIAQATLNNVPVSSLYSVAGSNASFYDLPANGVASGGSNSTYRLRVTITGVNGTTSSAHSTQYTFSVGTGIAYECASPSNNGGPREFGKTNNNFQKTNTSDKQEEDFPIIKMEGDSPR